MSKFQRAAEVFGRALAGIVDPLFGDTIRKHYAEEFGHCRVCNLPLGGESPERVCESCHAGEVLAKGFADGVSDGGAET